MAVHVPDRFKVANAFWIGLGKIGLTPAKVLSQARLPVTLYDGKKNLVTTAQFFALWRAVGELSADPAAGLKIASQIDVGDRPPSTMAGCPHPPRSLQTTMFTRGVANQGEQG